MLNADGVPVMGRKVIAVRGQADCHPAERERRPVTWTGSVVWHVLRSRATVGEACNALREVWGTYRPPDHF